LSSQRLARSKAAYTTRRVTLDRAVTLLSGDLAPRPGDLVLARIERLGQHKRLELATGRRAHLHVDDEVVVTYGARYAPDQFEAYVPADLGPCDLVAAGGIAADCRARHGRMRNPTRIMPLGLLCDADGRRLNLADWALPEATRVAHRPPVIAVAGTMMNAGKTTCAGQLIRGLKTQGLRVGAAKVTGTGAGGDRWVLIDAGADAVLDFTDTGVPSTFGLSAQRVEAIFLSLVDHLAMRDVDAIVIEIADGLCQQETAALLESQAFRARSSGILFAAGDALGALAGVQQLERMGHRVLAVGGAMTASPMATREAARLLSVPVVTSKALATARWLPPLDSISERSNGATDADRRLPAVAARGSLPRYSLWMDEPCAAHAAM